MQRLSTNTNDALLFVLWLIFLSWRWLISVCWKWMMSIKELNKWVTCWGVCGPTTCEVVFELLNYFWHQCLSGNRGVILKLTAHRRATKAAFSLAFWEKISEIFEKISTVPLQSVGVIIEWCQTRISKYYNSYIFFSDYLQNIFCLLLCPNITGEFDLKRTDMKMCIHDTTAMYLYVDASEKPLFHFIATLKFWENVRVMGLEQ